MYKKVLLAILLAIIGASHAAAQTKEMYVVYETSGTPTMRFYYDNLRSTRTYQTFDVVGTTVGSLTYPGWVSTDAAHVNQCAGAQRVAFDSSFADARPTSTAYWFYGLSDLTLLLLNNLDVSEVTWMNYMFCGCSSLTQLDLSAWDTSNLQNMDRMFKDCSSLTTIFIGDKWKAGSGAQVFEGCTSLVGGEGTTYDSSMTAPYYANTDYGLTNNPGYMTPLSYAIYNTDQHTLTFYHNTGMPNYTGNGMKFSIGNVTNAPPYLAWHSIAEEVQYVNFDSSFANARPRRTTGWFADMTNLVRINNLGFLNTSEVTDMSVMFSGCSTLTSLDVSGFNTSSVTDMGSMFFQCSGLTSLSLSNFDTSKVTDMGSMFFECNGLESLDLSNFNTSMVMDMSSMFNLCSGLTSLDLSNFNTGRVTSMSSMFGGCRELTSLDLSHFNTSKVTTMYMMFVNCFKLQSLDLTLFSTPKVTDFRYMFSDCTQLATINCYFDWNKDGVQDVDMFKNCRSLTGGAGTSFDTNHIGIGYAHPDGGTANPGYFTFTGSSEGESYAYVDNPNGSTLTFYHDGLRQMRSATGTTYDLPTNNSVGWSAVCSNIRQVVFDATFADARPTITYNWFNQMSNLITITGIENLNTSAVTDMQYMFKGCSQLRAVDVSGWNTSNVTSMAEMFRDCSTLTQLDVSHWDVSNVSNMSRLFSNCSGLTELDLSSFDTQEVTNMSYMFYGCSQLSRIFVGGGWNMANVGSNTYSMFNNCSNLVGGYGTTYDPTHVDGSYAHVDGLEPGYLTDKQQYLTQPYAMLSADGTLTFYGDGQWMAHADEAFPLNFGNRTPSWFSQRASVAAVVFDPSFANARPKSTSHWFDSMTHLAAITGIEYLNTSEVTTMRGMFQACTALTSVDLSGFDTQAVADMTNMFYGCSQLQTIFVGAGWTTASVTAGNNMFADCPNLEGGSGTAFDSGHVDVTYARVDGAEPGYLTDIQQYLMQPYAVLADGTLTFYADGQWTTRTGAYLLADGSQDPGWLNERTSVTEVVFDPSFANARPTSTYRWFNGMSNLVAITGIEYLNTSEVTTMNNMFRGCSKITVFDLSGFDTHQVTDMSYMFAECNLLTAILVGSGWSTASVTAGNNMFSSSTKLEGGNGTRYDYTHVDVTYARLDGGPAEPGYLTDKQAYLNRPYAVLADGTLTFYADGQWTTRTETVYPIPVSRVNPSWYGQRENITAVVFDSSFANARPKTMYSWFSGMKNLLSISGLELVNTSEVTDMSNLFYYCQKLTSLDVTHFDTRQVTTMENMFGNCIGLTELDLTGFVTTAVTDMTNMLGYCTGLTELDLTSFDTQNVTKMSYMFNTDNKLVTIFASDWTLASDVNSEKMFYYCTKLVGARGTAYDAEHMDAAYAHLDGGSANPGYFTDREAYLNGPYALLSDDGSTLTFYADGQGASHPNRYLLNVSNNQPSWIAQRAGITTVVFDSSFANARPVSTYMWFYGMTNLTSIVDIRYLNTSEVTTMAHMFRDCRALTELDLGRFNTSKVTDMGYMFYYCRLLTSLDLSRFNTSKVTTMDNMFGFCYQLKTLNVSTFNTYQVTRMYQMFQYCQSLKSLDLTTFNTANVTLMTGMFYYCTNLECIMVSAGWTTEKASGSDAVFTNCIRLAGEKGTAYRTGQDYLYYARLDGGSDAPGYFSSNEAYVVFSDDGATLTFYYDTRRSRHTEGISYQVNRENSYPDWRPSTYNDKLTKVVFDSSFSRARPKSTGAWFYFMRSLNTFVGLENLNTSEVTNMGSMFGYCTSLTTLDLTRFKTNNVTSMSSMFYGCTGLTTIYVNEWSTESLTSSGNMFYNCSNLVGGAGTTYNSSHLDATYACIDGGPSSSTPGYFSLKPEVYAFIPNDDAATTDVDESQTLYFYFDTSRTVRKTQGMTYDLNLGTNYPAWNNKRLTIAHVVFDNSFADVKPTTTYRWFYEMRLLTDITGLDNLNTEDVTNMSYMFYSCYSLLAADVSHFNTEKVTDMTSMFSGCNYLASLDVSHFNTENVNKISGMFNGCQSLTSLDVSAFNTQNVTTMTGMFNECQSLTSLDVSEFDTQNVTDMSAMFKGCKSLTSLDVTGFNTEKVVRMNDMFNHCDALTSLDLSGFDTNRVIDMSWMFYSCINLTSLDLSTFDTRKVTNMSNMFYNCKKLTSLDISSFSTGAVTSMSTMFRSCTNLLTIFVGSEWTTGNVTSSDNMFLGCTNLVGGAGTTFDAEHIDAAYAHVDGGADNPGYFTAKSTYSVGDVNKDGKITIADVTALVNIILGKTTTYDERLADVNDDKKVTIADVTALVNIILGK